MRAGSPGSHDADASDARFLADDGLLTLDAPPLETRHQRPWRGFPEPPPPHARTHVLPPGRVDDHVQARTGRTYCLEILARPHPPSLG